MVHKSFEKTVPVSRLLKQKIFPFPGQAGPKTTISKAAHICQYSQLRGVSSRRGGHRASEISLPPSYFIITFSLLFSEVA